MNLLFVNDDKRVPKWARQLGRGSRKMKLAEARAKKTTHTIEFDLDNIDYTSLRRRLWEVTNVAATALEETSFSEQSKRRALASLFDQLDNAAPKVWAWCEANAQQDHDNSISEISAGGINYVLKRQQKVTIRPTQDRKWEYSVSALNEVTGHGDTITAAEQDFKNTFHRTFQKLVGVQQFEMDANQQSLWESLKSIVDLEAYWNAVPIQLIETGVLVSVLQNGYDVVWLDGTRSEFIPSELTTPEFAIFEPGQWFEALAERRPKSYELRCLRYVKTVDPITEMTAEELEAWFKSLPSPNDTPKATADWATL